MVFIVLFKKNSLSLKNIKIIMLGSGWSFGLVNHFKSGIHCLISWFFNWKQENSEDEKQPKKFRKCETTNENVKQQI
jgi:hypothetical protein